MRAALFIVSAAVVAALLLKALAGIPPFGDYRGPYGDKVIATVIDRCNNPQSVAAVTFAHRGFDTLGEEFMLYTAVAGSLLLLRREREEHEGMPRDQAEGRSVPPVNDGLRVAGMIMFPVAFVLGISMILHGHLTPGGGFQGGVLVASAFYFVYLSGEYQNLATLLPDHILDLLEAFGACAFAVVASVPLLQGRAFMTNILPLGSYGDLLSAGTIPLFNCAVGLEVAAAFLLLISSFLRQALVVRGRGRT